MRALKKREVNRSWVHLRSLALKGDGRRVEMKAKWNKHKRANGPSQMCLLTRAQRDRERWNIPRRDRERVRKEGGGVGNDNGVDA